MSFVTNENDEDARQKLVKRCAEYEFQTVAFIGELESMTGADRRWLAIAKTDIEKGFMALRRGLREKE